MGQIGGTTSRKLPGWDLWLNMMIEDAFGRPFCWGHHDCATWASDVVGVLIGRPSAADRWRGAYSTARGAQRFMRRQGWPDMAALGRCCFGAPLAGVRLAQRGDLLLHAGALGICTGEVGAFIGPEGLASVPLAVCDLAWRV